MNGTADSPEEEECGFCIFMKEGGCKDPFTVSFLLLLRCQSIVKILSPVPSLCKTNLRLLVF